MPVTAPRCALILAAASLAFAAKPQTVADLFASLASALSEENSQQFMKYIDSSLRGRDTLEANIGALTNQTEMVSSIDVLRDEGDEQRRSVEVDWFLQIRSQEQTGPLERRRKLVKCRLERRGNKWKIVSLEPLDLFAPLTAK